MADKLSVYNAALANIGERPLLALTEEGPTRRALDGAWDLSVRFLLEHGFWRFATRAVQLSQDEDVNVGFGFQYAHSLPDDFVRLAGIASTPTFFDPLTTYEIERNLIFTNNTPIYIRYVSDGVEYGGDIGSWPTVFVEALSAYLAFKIVPLIKQSDQARNDMYALFQRRITDAQSKDAMDKPSRHLPRGSFRRARSGFYPWSDTRL